MTFREARRDEIRQIQIVRKSVKENVLSDPSRVTDQDCEEFLVVRGKGWVCETDGQVVGFAIADLKERNIWALFVHPGYEGRGIGRRLHGMMLDWYFAQTMDTVFLGTAFDTRAERFYRKAGWKEVGTHGPLEIRFEMTHREWTDNPGR